MSYLYNSTLYRTADARDAAIAYDWMTGCGSNSHLVVTEIILNGMTPEEAADEAIKGWDLLAVRDEDDYGWRGGEHGQPVNKELTRETLVEAFRDFFEQRPDLPEDDEFVSCETADGYSLHAPDSSDEDIAEGYAPALVSGPWLDDTRTIPASAYEQARKALAGIR